MGFEEIPAKGLYHRPMAWTMELLCLFDVYSWLPVYVMDLDAESSHVPSGA